jgi:hypothetical protein
VIQMAAKIAFLDRVLGLYGPEATDARREVRGAVADAVRHIWPTERSRRAQLAPNEQAGDAFTSPSMASLRTMTPNVPSSHRRSPS